ncbi:MAG TPA: hypothetical protein DDZ80_10315 [Cyanobacteria bacterium UBA8803]|nr:hypothetical protein [Cyanobacteria bacterium UBA9273]HBL58886.1 hypothetical protein [Cyanobacteria bacterium UBA8803]
MFDLNSTKKSPEVALDSEKSQPSQSTLDIIVGQKLVVRLDECNEESLLGGSFTGKDRILPRLSSDISPYEGCDPGTCC